MTIMRPALVGLTLLLGLNSAAGAAAPGLFNSVEFKAESLAALPQWQRVLKRIDDERPIYQRCIRETSACPTRSVVAWQGMIRTQIGRSQLAQIDTVNRFLNDWRYRADSRNWGERDYWATPLEFLRFSGDCEDYAIAKYVTLRQLGFAAEQLRMVVVQDTVRDLAHAVLAVYVDEEVYILDNLSRTVLRQKQVSHYVPYYSINEDTRWAHVIPTGRKLTVAGGAAAPGAK